MFFSLSPASHRKLPLESAARECMCCTHFPSFSTEGISVQKKSKKTKKEKQQSCIPAEKKHGAFSSLSRLLCLSLISDFLFPGRSSRTTNPEIRIQKQILMQSPMPSSSSSSPAALFLRPFLRLCGTAAAEECARYRAAAAALRHASISLSAVARSKGLERGSVSYPPRP